MRPLLTLALVLPLASGQEAYLVERNRAIPMRDGVSLAADIYFPAANGVRKAGRFPVILTRTPYDKSRVDGAFYASRGYVFVAQDTRGRYASEGEWSFLTADAADGHDTAAWIVRQPWRSGRIGGIGASYVGGTQHALAIGGAPGLAALIPVDAVANAGYFGMRNSGAFELRFFQLDFHDRRAQPDLSCAGPRFARAAAGDSRALRPAACAGGLPGRPGLSRLLA